MCSSLNRPLSYTLAPGDRGWDRPPQHMDWMRSGILQREGWGRGGGKDARKRETKMAPNRSLTSWNHIHPRLCSQCGASTILLEFLLNHKELLLVKSQNTLSSSGQPPGSLPGTAFLKVTTLLLLTPQVQFACCYTSWKQHSMECAFMTVHFPVCVLSWSKVYFLKKSWLGHFPHSTNIRNCATFKDFPQLFQKRPCLQMKQSLWWWILSASAVNHRWPRLLAVGPMRGSPRTLASRSCRAFRPGLRPLTGRRLGRPFA